MYFAIATTVSKQVSRYTQHRDTYSR